MSRVEDFVSCSATATEYLLQALPDHSHQEAQPVLNSRTIKGRYALDPQIMKNPLKIKYPYPDKKLLIG